MSRPCSLGTCSLGLTLLFFFFLDLLIFLSFFCFLICLGVCFLATPKGKQQSWVHPLGSKGENFCFAPGMDRKHMGNSCSPEAPVERKEPEETLVEGNCSEFDHGPQILPGPPAYLPPSFLLIPNRNDSRHSSPDSFQQGPQQAEAQA